MLHVFAALHWSPILLAKTHDQQASAEYRQAFEKNVPYEEYRLPQINSSAHLSLINKLVPIIPHPITPRANRVSNYPPNNADTTHPNYFVGRDVFFAPSEVYRSPHTAFLNRGLLYSTILIHH